MPFASLRRINPFHNDRHSGPAPHLRGWFWNTTNILYTVFTGCFRNSGSPPPARYLNYAASYSALLPVRRGLSDERMNVPGCAYADDVPYEGLRRMDGILALLPHTL